MRTALILFLTQFFSFISYTQVLPDGMSILESEKFELPKKTDFSGFIGQYENSYVGYAFNQDDKTVFLMRFSQQLKEEQRTQVSIKNLHQDASLESVLWFNNEVNLCYSVWNKDSNMTVLYVAKYSWPDFEKRTQMMLLQVKDSELNEKASFKTIVSKDLSKVGVVASYTTGKEQVQKKVNYEFTCFNNELNLLWKYEKPDISAEGELGSPFQLQITNEGMFVFNLITIEINQETIDELMDYIKRYVILVRNQNDMSKFELSKEGFRFGEIVYDFMPNGNINVVSSFFEKETQKIGYYYLELNKENLKVELANFSEFGYPSGVVVASSPRSNSFVDRVLSEFYRIDSELNFHDLKSTETGCTLTGEVSFKSYYAKSNYNHLGALIVNFNKKGEIVYEVGIPKIQLNKEAMQYGSIGNFSVGSKIGLVTNHLPGKQTGGNFEQQIYEGKKATSFFITMVDDGDYRTTELVELKAPFYCPQFFYENKNNNVIIYGNKGTEYGFLEILIE